MAQLIWTGTDEQEKYNDDERSIVYWPSQRPVDVPEDVASEYLEHEGWQEKEDENADLVERTIEEHDQARAEAEAQQQADREMVTETNEDGSVTVTTNTDGTDDDAGGDRSEDAEPEVEADADSADEEFRGGDTADDGEAVPEEDVEAREEAAREQADTEFDANRFLDGNWNSVSAAIRKGVADDHLDAVEEAERDRPEGPRENSVLTAIEDRRQAIDSALE